MLLRKMKSYLVLRLEVATRFHPIIGTTDLILEQTAMRAGRKNKGGGPEERLIM